MKKTKRDAEEEWLAQVAQPADTQSAGQTAAHTADPHTPTKYNPTFNPARHNWHSRHGYTEQEPGVWVNDAGVTVYDSHIKDSDTDITLYGDVTDDPESIFYREPKEKRRKIKRTDWNGEPPF